MNRENTFQCLLCKSKSLSSDGNSVLPFHLIQDGTRDSFHKVVQCKKCGHIQLFPLPSVDEEQEYYNQNIHDKATTPSLDIDGIYKKFQFQNESRIKYLQEYINIEGKKLLDYACGYGFFLQMLHAETGLKADGLEISQERLEICSERLHLEQDAQRLIGEHFCIYNINLLKEEVPQCLYKKYDIVTMYHLLEHIVDPVFFLNKVKALLNDSGTLLVELPNYDNIMMEASKEFKRFFFIRDHVSYYTPSLLRYVLEQAGYEVEIIKGVQLYGLENHMNWLINKGPQYLSPSYEISSIQHKWLEDIYKARLDETVKSEYMYAIAHIKNR